MKIVLAPDSFKECLSAGEVCAALRRGILARHPTAEIVTKPMADGGEGTLEVLREVIPGERIAREVTGPLGETIRADYLLDRARGVAVIEAARVVGLERVRRDRRDPLRATTRGLGELILDALARGARALLVAVGGTATVEGGTGLARALGWRFLDARGAALPEGGGSLADLARIEAPAAQPWRQAAIEVACDVTHPLLGEHGAARTFGPQKGATPERVERLEAGLARLAHVIAADLGVDPSAEAGAGAAGGLGAGLAAFAGAKLRRGADLVMERIGLEAVLAGADLVITGEGRTDGQSAAGKVCAGVAALAARRGVPCVVLSGALREPLAALHAAGVTAAFSASPGPQALEEALAGAAGAIARTAGNIAALFAAARGDLP
ncbi:MAG: glycerate kinase [Planctomycetes bacterium]|nr:glycerate kinase [Planctomycetota bacterium]